MIHDLPLATAAPEPTPRRESDLLRDCSRLVALLADQVEALESGDHARAREIGRTRDRLAEEMRGDAGSDPPLADWLLERLETGMARVEEWAERDRRRRDLDRLQDRSLPLVMGIRRSLPGGHYLELDAEGKQLDVRL